MPGKGSAREPAQNRCREEKRNRNDWQRTQSKLDWQPKTAFDIVDTRHRLLGFTSQKRKLFSK